MAFVEEVDVFRFEGFEVEIHAKLGAVLEENFPLVEAGTVEAGALIVCEVWENVAVVSFDIQREEREDVEALPGEVVDGSDDSFAFAVLPRGISFLPVLFVRCPVFDEVVFVTVGFEAAVEPGIGEEILGGVGSCFEEEFFAAFELEVVLPDVGKAAVGTEVPPGFVSGRDLESSGGAIEVPGALSIFTNGDVGAGCEFRLVGPFSGLIRSKVNTPR